MRFKYRAVNGFFHANGPASGAVNIPHMAKSLIERIDRRLSALGKTDRGASIEATGKPDTIRAIRSGRTANPRIDTIRKLAAALETTPEWLLNEEGHETVPARQDNEARPIALAPAAARSPSQDVPVYGLAAGSVTGHLTMSNEPIEWVEAPRGVEKIRDCYALIVTGTSMLPLYTPGETIFIAPHRPIRQGDHVVIQEAQSGGTVTSVKRFERQDADHVFATQYNPLAEIRFNRSAIDAMHRVLTANEVAGI